MSGSTRAPIIAARRVNSRTAIVANPAAGNGRGGQITARVLGSTGPDCPLFVTHHMGDEARCVRAAIADGATTIIAVGGDGTWSKVAAAIVAANSDCRLALIAAGTGNDFAKSVGAPATDIAATVALANGNADGRVDVLRIGDEYCLNVAGFGFDAHVLDNMRPVPVLSGHALYAWSALRELFSFRGIEIDAGFGWRNYLILAVCNGARFGGQFHIAPNARIDDGKANIISVHDAKAPARMRLFASVMHGGHMTRPDVAESMVSSATLQFREPPVYEIDGELHRASDTVMNISVLPRALRVVTTSIASASPPGPAAP